LNKRKFLKRNGCVVAVPLPSFLCSKSQYSINRLKTGARAAGTRRPVSICLSFSDGGAGICAEKVRLLEH